MRLKYVISLVKIKSHIKIQRHKVNYKSKVISYNTLITYDVHNVIIYVI